MNLQYLAQATPMPESLDWLMIILGLAYAVVLLVVKWLSGMPWKAYFIAVPVATLATAVYFGEELHWVATVIDDVRRFIG